MFTFLCPRLHFSAGDGGRSDRGVTDLSVLCALRRSGTSALGPRVGSTQQPGHRQRLDVSGPRQEPLDRGERKDRFKMSRPSSEGCD